MSPKNFLISPKNVLKLEFESPKNEDRAINYKQNLHFNKSLKQGILLEDDNEHAYEFNNYTKNIQGVSIKSNNKVLSPKLNFNNSKNSNSIFSLEDNNLKSSNLKKTILNKLISMEKSPNRKNLSCDNSIGDNSITIKNISQDPKFSDIKTSNTDIKQQVPSRRKMSDKLPMYSNRNKDRVRDDRKSLSFNKISLEKEFYHNIFQEENNPCLSSIKEEDYLNLNNRDSKVEEIQNNELTLLKSRIQVKINNANNYQDVNEDKFKRNVDSLSFSIKDVKYEKPSSKNTNDYYYTDKGDSKNTNDLNNYLNFMQNDDINPIETSYLVDKNNNTLPKNFEKYLRLIENNEDTLEDDNLAKELLEACSDESSNRNSSTPKRMRNKIIKNLENFKIGNVKQKLQKLFLKYNKLGSISPFSHVNIYFLFRIVLLQTKILLMIMID